MYEHLLPYKSRAEHNIGSLLDHYQIPFIYEKPTAVVDEGHTKLWHPDFTLAHGPIIEYFGITGRPDYIERTIHKLKVYQENQYNVIPVYPGDMQGDWQDIMLRRIDATLSSRLREFRARTGRQYQ